jgi:hypothetical protein
VACACGAHCSFVNFLNLIQRLKISAADKYV